jgi:DNA-binding NtrC family response regulator
LASKAQIGSPDSLRIIGRSPSITRLRAKIPQFATSTEPLVIIGETGVGKTLLAKAIHAPSPRKTAALRSINFSILSEREQRVALLGGGPPDLTTTRRSCLEPSSTIILKHIDHANPFLQEQLAKALETRKVIRLGSNTTHFALGRVILTFKEPLPILYRKGRITDPLFLRLREYEHVTVPPLRKRKEDIPLLVEHFLNQFLDGWNVVGPDRAEATRMIKSGGKIQSGLLRLLRQQRWEHNVVQLKAYIRSLMLRNHRDSIQEREKIELMKMMLTIEEGNEFSLRQSLSVIEEGIIQRALLKNAGHQAKAAQLLGISDRAFRRTRTNP